MLTLWGTANAYKGGIDMSNSTCSISDWENRTVLSIEEILLILGLGRSATYESARRGELPSLRLGRSYELLLGTPWQ